MAGGSGRQARAATAFSPEPGIPETAIRYRLEVGVVVYLALSKGYSKVRRRGLFALTPGLFDQSVDLLVHIISGRGKTPVIRSRSVQSTKSN